MNERNNKNKKAWEYRAYEFWMKRDGTPEQKAKELSRDPQKSLKKHQSYFGDVKGKRIANLCGSNGRKAVPLALLGAEVTVFDISEENKKYALELAHYANTSISYVVGDIYDINLGEYANHFDILYLEGGILHYFHDLEKFIHILSRLLKKEGVLILSDFHPIKRCTTEDLMYELTYFNNHPQNQDIAYKQYFSEEEQVDFPSILYT
ncbi:class I SAM-dependent methyltransferase [Bacillus sp. B1-b2]|uniref:class I SAM-dependent methyltransferase n=1 Tax=Bacillus sp. B1-b2 TaxID=2653201 RepID=UPI001D0158D6|nr:class I SAM-dependent methyltransferase [Bacillus sp. B1-b2]